MIRLALFLSLISSSYALPFTLKCEGWYQETGGTLIRAPLAIETSDAQNTVMSGTHRDYTYKADWNKNLSTFYIQIHSAGKRLLFTTARVPTFDHPENFTDLNLPDGTRLSVNCEFK